MAKTNNLQDYLKDLYAGISSRKPNASKNPQDFRQEIENLVFTGDADAAAADIRLNKTAYVNDIKLTGTIEDYDNSIILDDVTYVVGNKPYLFQGVVIASPQASNRVMIAPNSGRLQTTLAASFDKKTYHYRFYFDVPEAAAGTACEIRLYYSFQQAFVGFAGIGALDTAVTTGSTSTAEYIEYANLNFSVGGSSTTKYISYTFDNLAAGRHYVDAQLITTLANTPNTVYTIWQLTE